MNMDVWIQVAVPLAAAVLTSSGLWAVVARRADKGDAERKMLVGLAHDRIVHLGCTLTAGTSRRTSTRISTIICTRPTKKWEATAAPSGSWRKCGSCRCIRCNRPEGRKGSML